MFSSLCKTALQNNQRKKQKHRPQMSNFTKWHLTHEIVRILPAAFSRFLWNLTFIFSGSHKKFSLVLLQITISTSTALKNVKKKRLQYSLNYSVTRFLSTENYNYSVSWWIPSLSDDQGMIAMLWRSEVEPDRPREKVTRAMTAKKFIKKCD